MKKLSIVTICYNSEQYIEESIKSVLKHKCNNIEYVIIDGGSTDKTLDIVYKYESMVDVIISEPDKGISDAFNKGVNASCGEYICFLNSDDYFFDDSLIKMLNNLEEDSCGYDVVYGNTYSVASNSNKLAIKKSYNGPSWVSLPFTFGSAAFKRELFIKYGNFDLNKKIAMDVDFILRFWDKIEKKHISEVYLCQRVGGISDTLRLKGYKEYFDSSKTAHGVFLSTLGLMRKYLAYYTKKFGIR